MVFQCHIAFLLMMPTILNPLIQNGGHQQYEGNVTLKGWIQKGGHQQYEGNEKRKKSLDKGFD